MRTIIKVWSLVAALAVSGAAATITRDWSIPVGWIRVLIQVSIRG